MSFNEIKCHVNTSLGLVGGDASPASPPVSAPVSRFATPVSNILTDFLARDRTGGCRFEMFYAAFSYRACAASSYHKLST